MACPAAPPSCLTAYESAAARSAAAAPAAGPPRVLAHRAAPRLPYRQNVYDFRISPHFGQRKLFVGLLDFLNRHAFRASRVVYVGAAPGTNIGYVAMLFPELQFELYDPAAFHLPERFPDLGALGPFRYLIEGAGAGTAAWRAAVGCRLHRHREYFTRETADALGSGTEILFVSDIRRSPDHSGTTEAASSEAFERTVSEDMTLQAECLEALRPAAALLKFRLEYVGSADPATGASASAPVDTSAGAPIDDPVEALAAFLLSDEALPATTPYLAGDIRLQAWAPPTSTETRLEVVRAEGSSIYARADYDPLAYEEELFYVNTVLREWAHYDPPAGFVAPYGYDDCFCCRLEADVWAEYLAIRGCSSHEVAEAVPFFMDALGTWLGQPLYLPPHGVHPASGSDFGAPGGAPDPFARRERLAEAYAAVAARMHEAKKRARRGGGRRGGGRGGGRGGRDGGVHGRPAEAGPLTQSGDRRAPRKGRGSGGRRG